MSDTESLDYLQQGFEPSSLTVPRLRSILVAHNIPYPSAAKKPQLIEIFTDKVLPQSRKILTERARARRTSKGITDADSQESTVTVDEELMPPPPTPRPRVRKTPAKVKSEESESDAPPAARSPTKRTPRPSTKHARASDTDTGTDADKLTKSVRKSRKASTPIPAATPKFKMEDEDTKTDFNRRESAFTYDNPFQSGSSPLAEDTSPSGEKKRRSVSGGKDSRRRKSSSRRQIDEPKVEDGIHPPTSATFEIPVSQLKRSVTPVKPTLSNIEPTEEFTPEAQLELVQEQTNGLTRLPARRQHIQRPNRIGKGPIWVVFLTLLGGYSTWYRQEKVAVGYCGVGREAHQIIPPQIEVPNWARILVEPQCEPCPPHAYCSSNLETHCEADFVLKPHPLSLGGLVPLTPTCEPDGEKVRRVQAVADKAVEELRERRAKFECGDLVDEAGVPEPNAEIDEEALKKTVSQKRRKGMGEVEFEELWAGAIGEILARDEVESNVNGFLIPSEHTDSLAAPLSPSSPSPAPSEDPSDSHWQNIASSLLL